MTFEVEVTETFHGTVRVTAGSALEAVDAAIEKAKAGGMKVRGKRTYSCGYVREVKDDGK